MSLACILLRLETGRQAGRLLGRKGMREREEEGAWESRERKVTTSKGQG